jgi:hypothetical protein
MDHAYYELEAMLAEGKKIQPFALALIVQSCALAGTALSLCLSERESIDLPHVILQAFELRVKSFMLTSRVQAIWTARTPRSPPRTSSASNQTQTPSMS